MPHAARRALLVAAVALSMSVNESSLAQDVVTTVVESINTVAGSASIGSFAYDPTGSDGGTIYSVGYGSGAELRRIANVGGVQQVTQLMAQSEWTLFLKNGNPNNGGGQPTVNGFLLNPTAIGSDPAYSKIFVADIGTAVTAPTRRNDLTQRFYQYGLTSGSFTRMATLADFATAAGLANPVTVTTSQSMGRQFAFSGDGQSAYVADSTGASAYGGIYRVNLATGGVTRLLADADCNTEPAVLTNGGVDTIFIRGGASTNNIGGIDTITFNGTSASARTAFLSATTLADFMETTTADVTTFSMAADAVGNLYLNNTDSNPDRRAIFKLDTAGRLSKVLSYAERKATLTDGLTNPNSNTLRIQPRSVQHPNGFAVTQLLYAESTPLNLIAGAYVFQTGDFDRDNDIDAADMALFRDAVTVRGGPAVTSGTFKFDLNGNDRVDWKDAQVLENFLAYAPDPSLAARIVPALPIQADADLNGVVDFADFQTFQANVGVASRSFVQGDFDGDNAVTLSDFQAWVNSLGSRSAVIGGGVTAVPVDPVAIQAFLAGQTAPAVSFAIASGRRTQFEEGYRSILLASSVTKSGTGTLVLDGANSHTGPTTVTGGVLEIADSQAAASSTVEAAVGGRVVVAAGVTPTLGGLNPSAGGTFDVGASTATVTAGLSPEALVAALLSARDAGVAWAGPGITSSVVAADVAGGLSRAVGWLDNGDGSVTFGYAAPGDSNLDGMIDLTDVGDFLGGGKFDTGLQGTWSSGDYNYDGVVDIVDVSEYLGVDLLDAGPYVPAPGGLGAVATVPEPSTSLGLVAGSVAAWLRLRRRKPR